ncbi:MAG: DUF6473 family protein [Planktotalea sp.]|uniref:DUF6473 family protein n=1 Tax=Planktotalea sp. TaxID=2029877 RepID=UPI003C71D5BF
MTYNVTGLSGLNYELCAYDGSRIQFRGPKHNLNKSYVAFLGTTETFGKFVARPFPTLLAEHLPAEAVNLGMISGGLDAYLNDPAILEVAKKADLRVVQVIGALNLSNHYFKVHPRRNDRFVCARETLVRLFPEVDFTEFHFTKAMLGALQAQSAERYRMVCDELQKIWLARMTVLLKLLGERTVLLWFAGSPPPECAIEKPSDPMLIDADMVKRMRAKASAYVQSVPDPVSLNGDWNDLSQSLTSRTAAKQLMGPNAHLQAAQALQETCAHLLS